MGTTIIFSPQHALASLYIYRALLYDNECSLFEITMSLSFIIGEFIATYKLASKIRTEFATAPIQFKGISNE